ncbi:MAG TPA: DUF1629 domain-containing protein [Polyangiaceae bacterium]|jgi:hypothetical protein
MFYFARQNLFGERGTIEVAWHTPITGELQWIRGVRFTRPVPHETLELDPAYGTNMADIFDTSVPLLSERLLTFIRSLGLDNVDAYPMTLKRKDTGALITGYSAVNVIGRVDAVDLSSSAHRLRFGKPYFTGSVTIDPQRCSGLEMFRLASGPGFIVVSERVARALASGGFEALLVQPTVAYEGA